MKITKAPIIVSAFILLGGGIVSLRDRQRLKAANSLQAKLTAKVPMLKGTVASSRASENLKVYERQSKPKQLEQDASTAELLTLIREITTGIERGDPPNPAAEAKLQDLKARLKSSKSSQWKAILSEIEKGFHGKELSEQSEDFLTMLGAIKSSMAEANEPEKVLEIASQFPAMFQKYQNAMWPLQQCIEQWSDKDPFAAVSWACKNKDLFPDLLKEGRQYKLMAAVAKKDPEYAFKVIGDLGIDLTFSTIYFMTQEIKAPEERTSMLVALRKHASSLSTDEQRDESLNFGAFALIQNAVGNDPKVGADWIAKAKFTPEQFIFTLENVTHDSSQFLPSPQLYDILIQNLPPDKVSEGVGKIVKSWVKRDYKKAGEWVSRLSNGTNKDVAIYNYCHEVAAYQPDAAVQWAMALPPGNGRNDALQGIHENWLKTDTIGRENFGALHGFR